MEQERFVKGISTCVEPMAWVPDEGLDREPCIILDRSSLEAPVLELDSGATYHLTKAVKRALASGKSLEPLIEAERSKRRFGSARPDEVFIAGAISLSNVVGIGSQGDLPELSLDAIRAAAERAGLPMIDMSWWRQSSPYVTEIDDEVDTALSDANPSCETLRNAP